MGEEIQGSTKLLVSKHKESDFVGHVPTFLTDEEIETLYTLNEKEEWFFAGTRFSGYNTKIRHCRKRKQINFPFYDRLMKYVNLYNDRTYNFHLFDERKRHEINMVRYDKKGMFFRPHRDYRPCLEDIHKRKSARKISISIQLSDSSNYGGGDLEIVESYTVPDVFMDSNFPPDVMKVREDFRHRFKTMKKKGSLTIFTSIHEHESTPLKWGKRDIVVGFLRGQCHAY